MCSHFPNTFSRGTVQKFRGTLVCWGTPFENPWTRYFPDFMELTGSLKCHQHPHLSPLSQMNPVHTHSFYFVQTQFNMHMSFKWLLFFILSDQNIGHITLPSHVTCPFIPSSLISPFLFPHMRLTNLFHPQIQCGQQFPSSLRFVFSH
jgi:hypothetical protein